MMSTAGVRMAGRDHEALFNQELKEAVQAYLATMQFCNSHVRGGCSTDLKSSCPGQHIVVLWSDTAGARRESHWRKFALWESHPDGLRLESSGVTKPGGMCERPVDYSVIYPTSAHLAA